MLLAHRRPQLLELIVDQVQSAWPSSQVDITLDRPSLEVLQLVDKLGRRPGVRVLCSPAEIRHDELHFRAVRQWQLEQLAPLEPRYAVIWDDDHVLEQTTEAKKHMDAGVDLIYAVKAYFWNTLEQTAHHIPEHRSVFFFRLRPGDQFPADRTIHAPAGVHDDPKSISVTMRNRLLDIGYLSAEERRRIFDSYKQVGKIDAVTRALVEPPILVPYRPYQFTDTSYWKFRKHLA